MEVDEVAYSKKELLQGNVEDAAQDILYYDRKNDEELTSDDVASLIENDEVTLEEMVDWFEQALIKLMPEYFDVEWEDDE